MISLDMNDPLHYTLRRMRQRQRNFEKVLDSHIEILIYETVGSGENHKPKREKMLRSL
jgi:hypothetical protein